MNYTEIIQSQVALLVDLNQQLASQATPEVAREIRKNIMLITKLSELEGLQYLESRVEQIEEFVLGNSESKGLVRYIKDTNMTLSDHEERLCAVETRIDPDAWEMLEDDDDLPDYPYEETLMGLRERVEKLEGAGD